MIFLLVESKLVEISRLIGFKISVETVKSSPVKFYYSSWAVFDGFMDLLIMETEVKPKIEMAIPDKSELIKLNSFLADKIAHSAESNYCGVLDLDELINDFYKQVEVNKNAD